MGSLYLLITIAGETLEEGFSSTFLLKTTNWVFQQPTVICNFVKSLNYTSVVCDDPMESFLPCFCHSWFLNRDVSRGDLYGVPRYVFTERRVSVAAGRTKEVQLFQRDPEGRAAWKPGWVGDRHV